MQRIITIIIFLSALGGAMPAHGAPKLIAAILSSDQPRYREAHRSFVKALAQRGFDQRRVNIVTQSPNPDPISWANTIRKFNAIGADLIVAYGAPAAIAAVRESEDIPVVFVDVYGPVESGVTRSMTSAGRNVAGVSSKVPLSTLIMTATGITPIRALGVIYSSREIGSLVQLREARRIAARQGFAVVEANVSSPAGLNTALSSLLAHTDCIYVTECSAGSLQFEKIVHRATERSIPVISQMPDAADKGALVSLEVSPVEQGQMAADIAAGILGGKEATRLPLMTPKKVDLVINMRTARALGLRIRFKVLSLATKILK